MGTCNCGRLATVTDPRNDAARCAMYPDCYGTFGANIVENLKADLARVTAERDVAREVCDARKAETYALRAEVEAMRGAQS